MLLLTILMTGFAAVYYGMNHAHDQFRGLDTRIDGIYFTVTTLSTVGYGDITAFGQTGRVGHVQMVDIACSASPSVLTATARRLPRWAPRHGRRGRRHLRRGRGMPVRARQCGSRWIHGDESAVPRGSARTDGGARRLRAPDGRMPHARRGQRRRRLAGYAVLEAYLHVAGPSAPSSGRPATAPGRRRRGRRLLLVPRALSPLTADDRGDIDRRLAHLTRPPRRQRGRQLRLSWRPGLDRSYWGKRVLKEFTHFLDAPARTPPTAAWFEDASPTRSATSSRPPRPARAHRLWRYEHVFAIVRAMALPPPLAGPEHAALARGRRASGG